MYATAPQESCPSFVYFLQMVFFDEMFDGSPIGRHPFLTEAEWNDAMEGGARRALEPYVAVGFSGLASVCSKLRKHSQKVVNRAYERLGALKKMTEETEATLNKLQMLRLRHRHLTSRLLAVMERVDRGCASISLLHGSASPAPFQQEEALLSRLHQMIRGITHPKGVHAQLEMLSGRQAAMADAQARQLREPMQWGGQLERGQFHVSVQRALEKHQVLLSRLKEVVTKARRHTMVALSARLRHREEAR
jgi:hypothetical protein